MPTNLTELPLEVRDRIYDFVFHWEKVFLKVWLTKRKIIVPETSSWGTANDPNDILALLLVNHQICAECQGNFYGNHTFTGQPSDLIAFLKGIVNRRNLVKAVEVQEAGIFLETLYTQSLPLLSRGLSGLPVLRSLKLNMSKATFKPEQSQVSQFGINQLGKQVTIIIRNNYSVRWNAPQRIDVWTRAAGGRSWEYERGREESSDL